MAETASDVGVRRHFYGRDPSQFADLHRPAGQQRPGTVVLIHGGWWGPNHGADHLAGVATDLATRGWAVWNIEYRRLGLGGGYPATLEDADTGRVVAVGHSAGGHLATWAAGRAKQAADAPGAGPAVHLAGAI